MTFDRINDDNRNVFYLSTKYIIYNGRVLHEPTIMHFIVTLTFLAAGMLIVTETKLSFLTICCIKEAFSATSLESKYM